MSRTTGITGARSPLRLRSKNSSTQSMTAACEMSELKNVRSALLTNKCSSMYDTCRWKSGNMSEVDVEISRKRYMKQYGSQYRPRSSAEWSLRSLLSPRAAFFRSRRKAQDSQANPWHSSLRLRPSRAARARSRCSESNRHSQSLVLHRGLPLPRSECPAG